MYCLLVWKSRIAVRIVKVEVIEHNSNSLLIGAVEAEFTDNVRRIAGSRSVAGRRNCAGLTLL